MQSNHNGNGTGTGTDEEASNLLASSNVFSLGTDSVLNGHTEHLIDTEQDRLKKIKNDFFNDKKKNVKPLVDKIKQYISQKRDNELSNFIRSKETDDVDKIIVLIEPPVGLEANVIALQKSNNHVIAYWLKNNGKIERQEMFVDKVEGLVSFDVLSEAITPSSNNKTFKKLKDMFGKPLFSELSKNQVKDVVDHYVAVHKCQYINLMAHNILAYIGEVFYLYWDVEARMQMTPGVFPVMGKPLSSSTSITGNEVLNYPATAPIAVANFTFDPKTEIRDYFKSIIEDPNNALGGVLKKHPVLATMFALFSFGGGYAGVVDLQDWLQEKTGTAGRYLLSTTLVYAALVYYTVYNFNDVIQLYDTWKNSDSLVLKAAKDLRQGNFGEAATNGVVAIHEFLTLIERIFRMSYGGYEAGRQQANELVGIGLAAAVGVGTVPVALATRCMATRSFYDLSGIPKHIVTQAERQFNERFSGGFLSAVWREVNLVVDPAIFLQAAITWFTYDQVANATNNKAAAGSVASCTAFLLHMVYRNAAKRKMIVQSAKNILAEAMKDTPQAKAKLKTNKAGEIVSLVATTFDQSSRIVTFGFSVAAMAMFSDLLGTFALSKEQLNGAEPTVNYKNLLLLLLLETYITASAFRYQLGKTRGALTNCIPKFFAEKPEADEVEEIEIIEIEEENEAAPVTETSFFTRASQCFSSLFSRRSASSAVSFHPLSSPTETEIPTSSPVVFSPGN